ncbi:Callose synthase 5 [Linum grandiflorum]
MKPLIKPTKDIMNIRHVEYTSHEIFTYARHNYGAVLSLWAPTILVSANKGSEAAKFAQLWNEVITSFREDLISDRKGYTTEIDNIVKGFSLTCFNIEVANSFFKGDGFVTNPYSAKYGSPLQIKGLRLMETICADEYMKCAIIECCEFFKQVLNILVVGGNEKRILTCGLFSEANYGKKKGFLSSADLVHCQWSAVPAAPKPPYPVSGIRRPPLVSSSPTTKGDRDAQQVKKKVRPVDLNQSAGFVDVEIEDVTHEDTETENSDQANLMKETPCKANAWTERCNKLFEEYRR